MLFSLDLESEELTFSVCVCVCVCVYMKCVVLLSWSHNVHAQCS